MLLSIDRDRLVAVYLRAREIGLLGPGPVEAHIDHGQGYVAALAPLEPKSILDIGSGAGVPGLLLAMSFPAAQVTLLDVMAKRCAFLRSAIDELGLTEQVEVLEGRCEELAHKNTHRAAFGIVTARSFGPPAVTAECAVGFLKCGGTLIVSEPPNTRQRWDLSGMSRLGFDHSQLGHSAFVAFVRSAAESDYPRRVGIPNKRPLF